MTHRSQLTKRKAPDLHPDDPGSNPVGTFLLLALMAAVVLWKARKAVSR